MNARLTRILLPLGCLVSVFALAAGPRVINCASEADAFNQAIAMATAGDAQLAVTNGSASMKPLIPGRAVLVVKKDFSTAAVGEVLLYLGRISPTAPRKIPLCHRAIAADAGGFIMRGDGNAVTETWQRVTAQNYLGTVETNCNFP